MYFNMSGQRRHCAPTRLLTFRTLVDSVSPPTTVPNDANESGKVNLCMHIEPVLTGPSLSKLITMWNKLTISYRVRFKQVSSGEARGIRLDYQITEIFLKFNCIFYLCKYEKIMKDCLKDQWRKETSLQTFHEGNTFMDSVKFIHLFSQLLSMRKVTTFPPPSPSLSSRIAPKRHLNELTLMKAQALLLLFCFFDFGS